MIALALVGLAAMWVAVLFPEWWRDRSSRGSRKGSSIDAFHRQLDILGRAAPRSVEPAHRLDRRRGSRWQASFGMGPDATGTTTISVRGVPRSVDEAGQRRRVVLMALIGIAVLTLLLWLVTGSVLMLALHVAADVMAIGFGLLIRRHGQLRAERLAKVRYLAPAGSDRGFEPALVRSVR